MAVKTRSYLKTRFQSGDQPDAQDFTDLLDSMIIVDDDVATYDGDVLTIDGDLLHFGTQT